MTDNVIFSSSTSEQRWVDQVSRIFERDLIIKIEKLPCVFQVPKSIFDTKPEAYTPQVVGLGPYHHWRPELYNKMERHKFEAAKKVLKSEQLRNFRQLVIDKLKETEPIIRACYDKYLEHDFETLAWMLAIDSLYLINFLEDYPSLPSCNGKDGDPELRKLVRDLLLLENQIPVYVLKEIRKALYKFYDDGDHGLMNQLLTVCKAHSPLEPNEERKIVFDNTTTKCVHILSYMHNLIVQHRGIKEAQNHEQQALFEHTSSSQGIFDQFTEVARVAGKTSIGGPAVGAVLKFVERVPWKRISAMFGQDQDRGDPKEEKIRIPSVTQLSETAKIKFKLTKGGIRDVKFEEEGEERTFHLPVIQLHADSEVILRNLVAYEVATTTPGETLEFAEYVDLMCGVIDTPKDVQLLRDAKIIEGSLGNEEIAALFNGIRKTPGTGSMSRENKSSVARAVDQANQIFDNTRRIKVSRFFKKKLKFLTSKKFLSVILTIILIALLAVQAFCEIFGCSSRWFGKSN